MHATAVARWQNEIDLRHAIDRNELRLYYQPIRTVVGGELVEFEALVRWRRVDGTLVLPSEFIPLAEETGLIIPLGCWVVREACLELRKWHTRFPNMSLLSVGVNVSGKQFAQADLAEYIQRVLVETGVNPRQLKLEITENSVMEDAATTMAGLARLRELNLEFHMDDFGTGYSSLSYLHKLPIDALKIDRSFITAMRKDSASRSIVQAIVALGHSLNMRVIAEGVETAEQLEQLGAIGCDFAQGYLFSKPMPPEQVMEMLGAERCNSISRVA
jgi:EAL domain-containing protein (putative c-di-GMP-specific phosphodiesterase class I)